MKVNSIEWHKDCQKNFNIHLIFEEKRLFELQKKVKRMREDYDFRESQISEAIKAGKKSFDSAKFRKRKK